MFLRESTSQIIRFGPFLDSTDGNSPETALTIAQADMRLSKDGGAFAQKNASGNATHDSDGWYSTTLNTTDTNTVGILKLNIHVTGALAVWETFYVIDAATYDALTSDGLNNVAATDIVSAGAITTLSGAVVNVDLVDTLTTYTSNTPQSGDNFARIGAPAGASVSADIAALPTAAEVTDAVWDEAQSGHTTAGTFGKFLDVEVSSVSGGGGLTSQDVRDAMKLTPTAGAPASGSIDEHLDDIIAEFPANFSTLGITAGSIDTVTTVATTTNLTNLPSIPANWLTSAGIAASALDGKGDWNTVAPDNAGISSNGSAIAALNDISAADVNAQVVDVLFTDTYAEETSAPASTTSIAVKINWVFSMSRNKLLQTSTTQTLRNDGDGLDIASAAVSDDGTTFTRNKFS